jgi:predicted dehydrogenase
MSEEPGRRIRMGMVGGGPGSFIGPVHRMAAELDGEVELVAGAFSQDAAKSREAGQSYRISDERVYADYREMMERERARGDAMDFVCIATPNHLHLPVATAAMENGFHVVSDKPAAASLAQALALKDVVWRTGRLYALTYTYTGYPMIREARQVIRDGSLGEVRKVVVEYSQGWLSEALEKTDHKQAVWRVDPEQAGIGGAIGDIGVHALNLLEFVTGRRVEELCASLSSVVPGRRLDDDCNVLLKLDNGAPGVLVVSQISAGERNNLRLHVYGTQGGLHWSQENPNRLEVNWLKQPSQTLHAAASYLTDPTRLPFRLTLGLPEGLIEAFANIYRDFAVAVSARFTDPTATLSDNVPGIEDGVRGLAFVEQAVNSSRARAWVPLNKAADENAGMRG